MPSRTIAPTPELQEAFDWLDKLYALLLILPHEYLAILTTQILARVMSEQPELGKKVMTDIAKTEQAFADEARKRQNDSL